MNNTKLLKHSNSITKIHSKKNEGGRNAKIKAL